MNGEGNTENGTWNTEKGNREMVNGVIDEWGKRTLP